jgi:hypothetical protein
MRDVRRAWVGPLLLVVATVPATAAAAAPTPAPSVSATPTANLIDRQIITVTGSGLPPDASVAMDVCSDDMLACYHTSYRPTTDATGHLSTPFMVSRRVFAGTPPFSVGDCVSLGCSLLVNAPGSAAPVKIPLTFDPNAAFRSETAGVSPATALPYRTTVAVTGQNFDLHQAVPVTQCFADGTGEWCGTAVQATAGLDGKLTTHLAVVRRLFVVSRNHTFDCVATGTSCSIAVATLPGTTRVPLAFDPHAPVPPITVDLADDSVTEGIPATHTIVTMSEATDHPITIQYTVRHDTARPAIDYVKKIRHMTFLPGQTRHVISILIVDDHVKESTERFRIDIDSISGAGAAIGRGRQYTTIFDND